MSAQDGLYRKSPERREGWGGGVSAEMFAKNASFFMELLITMYIIYVYYQRLFDYDRQTIEYKTWGTSPI